VSKSADGSPSRLTTSQINRLGEKLRVGTISEELLGAYQEFRNRFAEPVLKVQAVIAESLSIESTARLKTVNSTIEKLRREKMERRINEVNLPEREKRLTRMAEAVWKLLRMMASISATLDRRSID
jgi:hypothetical protein